VKDVYPGQSIRFPVEKAGRFLPATGESWLKTYTIKTNPPTIDVDDSLYDPNKARGGDKQSSTSSSAGGVNAVRPAHGDPLFDSESNTVANFFADAHAGEHADPR
jgi:hypothetical protein